MLVIVLSNPVILLSQKIGVIAVVPISFCVLRLSEDWVQVWGNEASKASSA
jgi:hypothetical protein